MLTSEQIERIRILTNEDKTPKEITKILNLQEEYAMVCYYKRKFSSEIRKKITKNQERIIESKAELLQELTNWTRKMEILYNNIDSIEYSNNVRVPEERKVYLKLRVVASVDLMFRRFTEMLKDADTRAIPTASPINKELLLQLAPIARELREGKF